MRPFYRLLLLCTAVCSKFVWYATCQGTGTCLQSPCNKTLQVPVPRGLRGGPEPFITGISTRQLRVRFSAGQGSGGSDSGRRTPVLITSVFNQLSIILTLC